MPLNNYSGIEEYNWYFGKFQKNGKWFILDTAGHISVEEGFDEVVIKANEDSVFAVGKRDRKAVSIRLK